MRRILATASLSAMFATSALAQGPVQYRAADNINNIPVSAATPLPVTMSGGGGGSTGTVTTPSTNGQAAASGQNVNSQNLVYDSVNSLWRNWLGDPSGRGYVDTVGSGGLVFAQGNSGAAPAGAIITFQGGRYGVADGNAPVVPTEPVGGIDSGGLKRTFLTTPTGVLAPPQSSVANRVVTRTAVSASTSTTVCPASAGIVAETLFLPISGTGVGWSGQALTTATPGTANTTPEFATSAANFTWTPLVAPTNAITVYSGTAFTAVCVQDVRQ